MRPNRPRVLVADEYPDAAGSLADLLTLLGFEARAARTPGDALCLATAHRPDAIVMDTGWARIDGFSLAGELRLAAGGRAALVAVVGRHGLEDHTRAAGFDYCLLKPADPVGLARLLAAATGSNPYVQRKLAAAFGRGGAGHELSRFAMSPVSLDWPPARS